MKIPKKVKILGINYKVKFTDNINKEVNKLLTDKEKETDDLVGFCSCNYNTIFISTKTSKENHLSIFIHEILEAIDGELSLNLKHENIDRLETALCQVLTENKLLKC